MHSRSVMELMQMRAGEAARDWALFDVRERGECDAGHIFGATSLPRRQLEYRIRDLVPANGTEIVLYDDGDGDGRAERAAATLQRFGYPRAGHLVGGMAAWRAAGQPVTAGSNVPSKTFGERVHVAEHPPSLTAAELRRKIDAGDSLVICDVRTPEEYQEAHIPGSFEAPSFDFVLNAFDLTKGYETVVLNCAGRTRSIIATRTMRLLGIDNVFALENGTSGWLLEDRELERAPMRRLPAASAESRTQAKANAARLADAMGVATITTSQLAERLAARGTANIYGFDVRSLAAYRAGHIPGTAPLPGGQAIQRADDFFAVPNGEVILVDDDDARAALTGYWLRRLGYPNVARLLGGLPGWVAEGRTLETGRPRTDPIGLKAASATVHFLDASDALEACQGTARPMIIDVGLSRQYAKDHLPDARWLPRAWLESRIGGIGPSGQDLLVVAQDESQAVFAAATLADMGYRNVKVLRGGSGAWRDAGGTLEQGEPVERYGGDDYILPPYQQGHEGMLRYLKWEIELAVEGQPAVAERL